MGKQLARELGPALVTQALVTHALVTLAHTAVTGAAETPATKTLMMTSDRIQHARLFECIFYA